MRERVTWIPSLNPLIFSAVLFLLIALLVFKPQAEKPIDGKFFKVSYIYDGDTIRLETGEKVRFIGIDAPEMHESEKLFRDARKSGQDIEVIKAMGRRAREFVVALFGDKKVRLEFDIEKRDKYGRLLAYLYLEDGTFVNKEIIASGFAYPLTIPPNVAHTDEFKALFKEARAKRLGLWSGQ
ncbi:MAG: thermonuclease family protein [Candidatus Omnitrophica bacterium]|nr:thermonuclease family protein [Candidatus Omnitrophota bacterium]